MAVSDCTIKKILLQLVLIFNLAQVFSRSLPAGNIPYQVAPLSITYPFQGNPALPAGYYSPQLTHAYQPPSPAGTFYDSKRGILRSFPGGGVPVLVDHYKRCSGNFLGIKPHPNQHQYYYVCKPDCVIFGRCQNLQFFDSTKGQCSLYPTPEYAPVCTKPGRFPILSDCTIYYRCDEQLKPRIYSCPRNTVFSPRENKCICGAQCNPTEVSSHGSHIPLDCENKFPPCLQDGTFRAPTDCSLYYTCVMQSKGIYLQTRFKCPELTFFDTAQKVCRPQYEVACDSIQLSELVYPKPTALSHLPVIYPPHYDLDSLEDSEYPAEYSISCSKDDPYSSSVGSNEAHYYLQPSVADSVSSASSTPDLESIEPQSMESQEADTTLTIASTATTLANSFTSSSSFASMPTTNASPSTTPISTTTPTTASPSATSSTAPATTTTLPTTSAEQTTLQTFPTTNSSETLPIASSLIHVTLPTLATESTPAAPTPTAASTIAPIASSTSTDSIEISSTEETTLSPAEALLPNPSTLSDFSDTEPTSFSADEITTHRPVSAFSPDETTMQTTIPLSFERATELSSSTPPPMSTTFTPTSTSTDLSSSASPIAVSTPFTISSAPNTMPTTIADVTTTASSLQFESTPPAASSSSITDAAPTSSSENPTPSTLSSSSPMVTHTPSSSSADKTTVASAETTPTTTVEPSTQSTRSIAASADITENEINPSETHDIDSNTNDPSTNEIRIIRSHKTVKSVTAHNTNHNADYVELDSRKLGNVEYSDEYDSDLVTTENALEDKSTEDISIGTTEVAPNTSTGVTPHIPESAKQTRQRKRKDILSNSSLDVEGMEDVENESHTHKGNADVSYYEDDAESNEVLRSTQKTTRSEELVLNTQATVTHNKDTSSHEQTSMSKEAAELTHTIATLIENKVTEAELRTSPIVEARTPSAIRQTLDTINESHEMPFESDELKISAHKRTSERHEENIITNVNEGVKQESNLDVSKEKSLTEALGSSTEETNVPANIDDHDRAVTESEESTTSSLALHEEVKLEKGENKSSVEALSGESSPETIEESNISSAESSSKSEENTTEKNSKEFDKSFKTIENITNATEVTRRAKHAHDISFNKQEEEHELLSLVAMTTESQLNTLPFQADTRDGNHVVSIESTTEENILMNNEKEVVHPTASSNSFSLQNIEKLPQTFGSSDKPNSIESESIGQTQMAVKKAVESHKDDVLNSKFNNDVAMDTQQRSESEDLKTTNFLSLVEPNTALPAVPLDEMGLSLTPVNGEAIATPLSSTEKRSAFNDLNSINFLRVLTPTEPTTFEHESHTMKATNESFEDVAENNKKNAELDNKHDGSAEFIQSQLSTDTIINESAQETTSQDSLNTENSTWNEEVPLPEMSTAGKTEPPHSNQNAAVLMGTSLAFANPSTLTSVPQAVTGNEEEVSEALELLKTVAHSTTTATQAGLEIETTTSNSNKIIEQSEVSIEQDSMEAETIKEVQQQLRNNLSTNSNENVDKSLSETDENQSLDQALEKSTGLLRVTTDSLQTKVLTQSAGSVSNESSSLREDDRDTTTAPDTTTFAGNTFSNDIHLTTISDTITTTTLTPTTTTQDEIFATTAESLESTTAHTTQLDIHFQDKSVNIESNDLRVARNALQTTRSKKSAYTPNQMTNTNSGTVAGYPTDATDIPKMEIAVFGNLDLTVLFCPKDCSEIHEHKYDKSVLGNQHVVGVQWDPAKSNKTMSLRTV